MVRTIQKTVEKYEIVKDFVDVQESRQMAFNLLSSKVNMDESFVFVELDQDKCEVALKDGSLKEDQFKTELEKLDEELRVLIASDPVISTVEDAIGIIHIDLSIGTTFHKSVNPYVKMTGDQQKDVFDKLFSAESIK